MDTTKRRGLTHIGQIIERLVSELAARKDVGGAATGETASPANPATNASPKAIVAELKGKAEARGSGDAPPPFRAGRCGLLAPDGAQPAGIEW